MASCCFRKYLCVTVWTSTTLCRSITKTLLCAYKLRWNHSIL